MSKELSIPSLDSRETERRSLDIIDVVRDSFNGDCSNISLETNLNEKYQSKDKHKYVLNLMESPRSPN